MVSLHEEYDIVMEHPYHRDCPYHGLSSHYYDGGSLVAEGVKWTSQQYLKYNVSDSVLLDSLTLKVRPNIRIDGYCFLDKDTVLVAANPSYERDLHDGILIVVDREQHIIDSISLLGYDVTMDGEEIIRIDVEKLTESNKALLEAYYKALIDSQGEDHANT